MTNLIYSQERREYAEAVLAQLKEKLGDVLARFPVELAYVHGSVARLTPLPTSDVDIAIVLSEPEPEAFERTQLELTIQAAIEDGCGIKNVDVRSINSAPLAAQGEIVQEGLCFYARAASFKATFESLIRRKYFDYQPYTQRAQKAFLHQVRESGLKRD